MAKTSSNKALVIVESPAKAKTINKYLGSGFDVKASMGHVRDLPSKGINVDLENDFEPTYDITPGRKKLVNTLKSAAKKCDRLYLATDLDREGEAIAWHLAELLGIDEDKTYRVVFNAITKNSIKEAFDAPGKLEMPKVMAQQARRILDRIVGYKISPLLWKKVAKGLSAGRVQSVAVKIVVEKEREIRAFVPDEYWQIPAVFTTDIDKNHSEQWKEFLATEINGKSPTIAHQNDWLSQRNAFKSELVRVDGKKFSADDEESAMRIFNAINESQFKVDDLAAKQTSSKASAPFITSTLQQAASNRLGFAAKRTMRLAQNLYEGIELGSMGAVGLITYMRTDSYHLSGEALSAARNFIDSSYGSDYLPEKPNFYSSKKNAQQAHEAIRPTDPSIKPGEIQEYLTEEQFKLYDLIWRRFVASQMTPSKWNVTTITIAADTSVGKCEYRTSGRALVFDGYSRIWRTNSTEQQLPTLTVGQELNPIDINAQQNFTKPPARYTEASLVKTLEKEGIGRPSTYASIISTIQDRNYVEQRERKFHATDLGEVVTDKLDEFFPNLMNLAFTRQLEEELDMIEDGGLEWVKVLHDFYGPFEKSLKIATEEMKHAKAETKPSEYTCPDCKAEMVYRFGKNGRFLSCSKYPECKFAAPCDSNGVLLEQVVSDIECPNCDKMMIEKHGRFGKFMGCQDYPNCKTIMKIDKEGNVLPPAAPPEPTGLRCQKCKTGELVIRQSKRGPFMGCNKFPRCRNIISMKVIDELKQLQEDGKWPPATIEEADIMLGRKKKTTKKKAAKKKTTKKKTTKKATKKTTKKVTKKVAKKDE